jgi:hypothetical protein
MVTDRKSITDVMVTDQGSISSSINLPIFLGKRKNWKMTDYPSPSITNTY